MLHPASNLVRELEQFLSVEAALLEDRRCEEWLARWAEAAHWCMPVRSEMLRRTDTGWLIVRRDVMLNAGVLSAINLEIFF